MGWKTVYSSVSGTSHQDRNITCQDYVDLCQVNNNIIIGAVADGAGSAKYSEHGSKRSVETTLDYFKQWKQLSLKTKPTEQEAREFCAKILQEVKGALTDKAKELGCSEEDLASTLLAFFATPNWTLFMQIGDGFIVSKSKNSDYFNLVFSPNKGEYINETTFVTSTKAVEELDVTVIDETLDFICASTDGLERLAINFSSGKAHPPFFNSLYLRIKENGVSKKKLEDWLNSPDVNARTDDDKTLLLCFNELCNQKVAPSSSRVEKKCGASLPNKRAVRNINNRSKKSQRSSFLSQVDRLVAVSFLAHLFAGSLLYLSYSLLKVFSALLLLSMLVTFITVTNLRDSYLMEKQSCLGKEKHLMLSEIIFSISLSTTGLSIGFFCSKLLFSLPFK